MTSIAARLTGFARSCDNSMTMAQSRIKDTVAGGEAEQFAIEQAGRLLRNLTLQINRTLKSSNADAVHHVRVAIRRFSQAIAVCRSCFPGQLAGKDMRKTRRRLKKIMTAAGEVRNCDIAMKFVGRWRVAHAVQLKSKLQSLRKDSAGILTSELTRWKDREMPIKLHGALDAAGRHASVEPASAETTTDAAARKVLSPIAKDFLRHGDEAASPKASAHDMHRFRIVAKKFRYTLELFQPRYGSVLDRGVAGIKHTSGLLGDINDSATVGEIVAEYEGARQLTRHLKKRQDKKTEEFRDYWAEQRKQGEQLRTWIDHLGRPVRKPAASSKVSSVADRKSA
jgi:CHAD domain-containing protein